MLDYVAYPGLRLPDRAGRGPGRWASPSSAARSGRSAGCSPTDRRMIFLGTLQLGDERACLRYGHDRERDMIGLVERIARRRWRLVFPYPPFRIPARRDRARPRPEGRNECSKAARRRAAACSPPSSAAPAHGRSARRPGPRRHAFADDLYRDLHANPELSMQETRSAAKLAAEARGSASTSPPASARPASSR
jgi:hypothetical protein